MKLKQKTLESLSRHRVGAIVLVLYVILTIIFTYPVAFSVNTFPGHGGDGYWFLWDLWAFKNAVFTHTNPLFTPYIFYPVGVSLAFSTTSFFNAALSVPLQLIWDLPHAYTFLWLMSFVLSGYGAFLLLRYLGVSTKVAFISGLIFMFSPYRFAHGMGQLNMMTTEWIPFYALFFLKTLRAHKRSDPVIAGLFLSLAAFSDFYYVIYLVAFSILAAAYYFWRERQHASFTGILKRIALTFVVFGALVSPLLIPMLQELFHGSYMYSPYGWFFVYSADLVAFFIPSSYHPLLGPEVAPLYSHFVLGNLTESTVFIGYVGLALSILAILKQRTHDVWFWAVALGVFLVLSLGPELQANGLVHVPSIVPYLHNATIHLPYAGLWHLPVFSIARVPSRWDVMVMLCVAVLSGFALQYLVNRSQAPGRILGKGNVLCVVVAGLILFEFLSVPYPGATTAVPAFYQQMGTDPQDYAVFEVAPQSTAQIMYYQTIHHKQLVNGYVSHTPPESLRFIETEPVVSLLSNIQTTKPGATVNTTSLDPSVLSGYNIKYVIVHRENLTQPQINLVQALFGKASKGAPVVYEEGPMIVYALHE
ncbi:MAG: hypothetical protein ACXV5N_11975 [Halobacteriota archaeon]